MEINDTSEILNDEDLQLMKEIQGMKNYIFDFLNTEVLIDGIVKLIEDSEYIDFIDELSKKFIDHKRPIFNIKIDKEKAAVDYPPEFKSPKEESDYYTRIIQDEIVTGFTTFLTKALMEVDDNGDVKDFLKNKSIFKDVKYEDKEIYSMPASILSTFGIRMNNQDNSIITLELFL